MWDDYSEISQMNFRLEAQFWMMGITDSFILIFINSFIKQRHAEKHGISSE